MARGMVVGEAVVSQAATDSYREGYERIFGKDHKPQRGHWVFEEAEPSEHAVHAPIMTGRCHEGQVAPDGTDISTRTKRARWMKETGTADFDDYRGAREAKAKEAEAKRRGEFKPDKQLRDLIGRELYKRKMIL